MIAKTALKVKSSIRQLPILGSIANALWQGLKVISYRLQIFIIVNKIFSLFYFKKVEYYQPLYGFNIFNHRRPQRDCLDRADLIGQVMKDWGKGGRILDVGCSLGFFSRYFSERGYWVEGIDYDPKNIEICRLLQKLNKNRIPYSVASFSKEYVEKLQPNQYDIIFLLSVMHHSIHAQGLAYAQELMAMLLKKAPILFVELALKEEQTTAPWRNSLPREALELFAKCEDISIQKLGLFPTHISAVCRPLYVIKKNKVQLCGDSLSVEKYQFNSFYGSPYVGRNYYYCDDKFVKKYVLAASKDNEVQIFREIETYTHLPQNDYLPQLLSWRQDGVCVELMFNRLRGQNVHDLLVEGVQLPRLIIFKNMLAALKFLFAQGLYHNDIRLWNLIYDGSKATLLDLGLAQTLEIENTNTALLWVIKQLHSFNYYFFSYPIRLPPSLEMDGLDPYFQEVTKALQTNSSFADFLSWHQLHYSL